MSAATRTTDSIGQSPLRYCLPALDGTVWLGLRPASLMALAVSITAAVVSLMAGLPLPVALAGLLAGGLLAALPVRGRPPMSWIPVLTRHGAQRLTRRTTWIATDDDRQPSPKFVGASGDACAGGVVQRLALPSEYGQLDLGDLTFGPDHTDPGPGVGVLHHRRNGTVSIALEVTGTDRFALVDPRQQDSQIARWGTCLSALSANPHVVRLQWLTHSRPDNSPHAPEPQHASSRGDSSCDAGLNGPRRDGHALQADYQALAAHAAGQAWTHRHLLILTVAADQNLPHTARRTAASNSRRPRSGEPTTAPRQAANLRLLEQVRNLAATLLTADLLPHALSAAELGVLLRQMQDPSVGDLTDQACTDSNSDPHRQRQMVVTADPRRWAVRSRNTQWDHCRTDDAWHRSYAVTSWPRLALPADWLAPLLHTTPPDGTSRTLAVHAIPVAPQHAARQARAARAKARLDATDRSRMGFTSHSSDDLAERDAAELETELIAGYRLTRLTGYVTITAPDQERLHAAALALRTLSVSHRLDLRPLHGQHERGLLTTLPLGMPAGGVRS